MRRRVDISTHREELKEIYAKGKCEGFDTKILRKIIRLRAMDPTARSEEKSLIDLCMLAVG